MHNARQTVGQQGNWVKLAEESPRTLGLGRKGWWDRFAKTRLWPSTVPTIGDLG